MHEWRGYFEKKNLNHAVFSHFIFVDCLSINYVEAYLKNGRTTF